MRALGLCVLLGLLTGGQAQGGTAVLGKGLRQPLEGLIKSSKLSLDIQMPGLNDEKMEKSLAEAVSRGVKVRLLLSPRFGATDASIQALRAAGAQLRWCDANARLILSDGLKAAVGSFNGMTESLDTKLEAMAVVEDPAVAASFCSAFEALWKAAPEDLIEDLEEELESMPYPQEPSDKEPRVKTTRRKL